MSEEIVVQAKEVTAEGAQIVPQSYFVASTREEMAKAQSGLTAWVSAKLQSVTRELRDVTKALEHARAQKWAIKPLQHQKNIWYGKRIYYEKMLAALQAGYVLVPEFPIDIFAIRTRKTVVPRQEIIRSSEWSDRAVIASDQSPLGEGEYKSNQPDRRYADFQDKDSSGKPVTKYQFFNTPDFQDVEFPMIAAKPEVMEASTAAMALKIFDSIGVCPPDKRRGDPLIIGVICGQKIGYTQKKVHFLISWHIAVEDL